MEDRNEEVQEKKQKSQTQAILELITDLRDAEKNIDKKAYKKLDDMHAKISEEMRPITLKQNKDKAYMEVFRQAKDIKLGKLQVSPEEKNQIMEDHGKDLKKYDKEKLQAAAKHFPELVELLEAFLLSQAKPYARGLFPNKEETFMKFMLASTNEPNKFELQIKAATLLNEIYHLYPDIRAKEDRLNLQLLPREDTLIEVRRDSPKL